MSVDRKLLWLGLLSAVIALVMALGDDNDVGLALFVVLTAGACLPLLRGRHDGSSQKD